MTSNVMRMTGIFTGMDTENMVRQMMRAESMKMDRLKQRRTIIEWRQQGYRNTAQRLRDFERSKLNISAANSMRLPSTYNTLRTNVTANGVASSAIRVNVKDSTNLENVTMKVEQAAKKDTYVGAIRPSRLEANSFFHVISGSDFMTAFRTADSFTVSLNGGADVKIQFTTEQTVMINQALKDRNGDTVAQVINDTLVARFGHNYTKNDDGDLVLDPNQPKVSFVFENGKFSFVAGAGQNLKIGQGVEGLDVLSKIGFRDGGVADSFHTNEKLMAMGFDFGRLKFDVNGATVELNVTSDTTVQDLMDAINESSANVTLTYDKAASAFKLESKVTGVGGKINIEGLRDAENNPTAGKVFSLFGLFTGSADTYTAGRTVNLQLTGTNVKDNFFDEDNDLDTPAFAGGNMLTSGDYFSINVNNGTSVGIAFDVAGIADILSRYNDLVASASDTPSDINHYYFYVSAVTAFVNEKLVNEGHSNVTMGFDPVRHAFTFHVESGSSIVISGPTGPGSTLEKLGFDKEVDIDGNPTTVDVVKELTQIGPDAKVAPLLREMIVVSESPWLVSNQPMALPPITPGNPNPYREMFFEINGKSVTVKVGHNTTFNDIMDQINAAGTGVEIVFDPFVPAVRDPVTGEIITPQSGNSFRFVDEDGNTTTASIDFLNNSLSKNLFQNMGFFPQDATTHYKGTYTQTSEAQDAVITHNGNMYTRSDNTFEINGVEFTINEGAVGQTFHIDFTHDSEKLVDTIRDFINEYNEMVKFLHAQLTTPRPTSGKYTYYEPLTDEQKNAMSEREVDLWEEKGKTGLLQRDEILTRIADQMRKMMYASVTREDGTKIAIHQVGITTMSGNGNIGILQLDEAKLKAAIERDPDAIRDLFIKAPENRVATEIHERNARMMDQGIVERMNDIIANAIDPGGWIQTHAGLENTASVRNNALERQMQEYDTRLESMLTSLRKREEYYYSLFARMENAMMKSNAQMEALFSSLGGS